MTIYIILAAVIIGFLFILRVRKKDGIETASKPAIPSRNPYHGLRNTAFKMRPEMLGITFINENIQVYGIIFEWEILGSVVSLVAYQTGDTSLYVSTGGAIIGGGKYPEVSELAIELVAMAGDYVTLAELNENHPLPSLECINFYFLTNQGVRLFIDNLAIVEKGESDFSPLFINGNTLLSELRHKKYN